jgi:transcription elongation factor SPT6
VGEFLFRPSSKGTNNITLTWKFYNGGNIVHIDIQEHEKAPGATIGSKLQVGHEFFDNLQEIVERYIHPVNRLVYEAINHVKFAACDSLQKLEETLKQEKEQEPQRIPYRFTILPEYPQYLVLGYIPRQLLKKEFIKVKPKGYWFHEE